MNDSSATPDVEVSPAKRAHLEHYGRTDHPHVVEWSLKTKKLKEELTKTHQKVSNLKKKLKTSNQTSRRLKTKVKSLKTVVKVLKGKNMISPSCEEMLNKTTSGVPLELFKRMKSTSEKVQNIHLN